MTSTFDDVVPRPILVMTRTTTDPDDMPELLEIAEESAPILAQQPGFVGGEIFASSDRTRLVTLLRWRREADHAACMKSSDFAELGKRLSLLVDDGRAGVEAHVLVRVGTVEPVADPA